MDDGQLDTQQQRSCVEPAHMVSQACNSEATGRWSDQWGVGVARVGQGPGGVLSVTAGSPWCNTEMALHYDYPPMKNYAGSLLYGHIRSNLEIGMHPMNTLSQREQTSALKPGDTVKAREFFPLTGDLYGELVDYTVLLSHPSSDVADPTLNARVVVERHDSTGKRHCHYLTHTHSFTSINHLPGWRAAYPSVPLGSRVSR